MPVITISEKNLQHLEDLRSEIPGDIDCAGIVSHLIEAAAAGRDYRQTIRVREDSGLRSLLVEAALMAGKVDLDELEMIPGGREGDVIGNQGTLVLRIEKALKEAAKEDPWTGLAGMTPNERFRMRMALLLKTEHTINALIFLAAPAYAEAIARSLMPDRPLQETPLKGLAESDDGASRPAYD